MAKPTPKKGPDDFTVQSDMVTRRGELRCNIRQQTVTLLQGATNAIVSKNKASLNDEQKLPTYPETLAIAIEHHLYLELWNRHCEPPNEYKNKARTIYSNVKSNGALQIRLLKGEITPERLAHMTSEEMAKKEMQILAEQVRRESELHNTILSEDTGPRIRRTHKGEEIVGEDDDRTHGEELLLYSSNAVDLVDDDSHHHQHGQDHSMSPTSHAFSEEPMQHSPRAGSQPPQTPQTPVTKAPQSRGRQFSIQDVWSNVENPDTEKHRLSISTQNLPIRQGSLNAHQPVNDPEIDKLLAEDHDMDSAESPPYSPSDDVFHNSDPAIWGGRLTMVGKADFAARASVIGGAEISKIIKLSDLLGPTVLIDGRIPIDRATEYLCGQRFSVTNEVTVLSVEPESYNFNSEFDKLFNYFQQKQRYGVIGNKSHPSIKDCYAIPVDAGDELPDFFAALKNHSVPKAREKKLLCIVLVLTKAHLTPASDSNDNSHNSGAHAISPPPAQLPHYTSLSRALPQFSHHSTVNSATPTPPIKAFNFKAFPDLENLLPQLTQKQVDGLNALVKLHPAAAQDPKLMLDLMSQHPDINI